MARFIALAANTALTRELVRGLIVLGCACALILAGHLPHEMI